MTLANKKKTALFVLLAMLTFVAFSLLTVVCLAVLQIAEFMFTLFSMGGETWLN